MPEQQKGRGVHVQFRLPHEVWDSLQASASQRGQSVGVYIKEKLVRQYGKKR